MHACDFHCRFEKYIGGKYLGELVRLVLLDLNQKKLVLQNTPADAFPEPWSLDTSKLSEIEEYVTFLSVKVDFLLYFNKSSIFTKTFLFPNSKEII